LGLGDPLYILAIQYRSIALLSYCDVGALAMHNVFGTDNSRLGRYDIEISSESVASCRVERRTAVVHLAGSGY